MFNRLEDFRDSDGNADVNQLTRHTLEAEGAESDSKATVFLVYAVTVASWSVKSTFLLFVVVDDGRC